MLFFLIFVIWVKFVNKIWHYRFANEIFNYWWPIDLIILMTYWSYYWWHINLIINDLLILLNTYWPYYWLPIDLIINDLLPLLMTYWPYYWWPIDLFQVIIVNLWLYWNQKEYVRRDTTVQRVLPLLCFLIVQWEPTVQQEVLYQHYVQMVSVNMEIL